MLRQALCCFLILTLVGLGRPVLAAEQSPSSASDLKRQLALIPAGKTIEVKLKQEGSKKITGKLGSVTDEGFEVQTVKSRFSLSEEPGKVSTEKIAFADVESVKKRGMSLGAKIGIGAGVGGVIAFLKFWSWFTSD
jgi:hypothetical protein